MILKHLELYHFKKFKQLGLDFKPGLNIIRGGNEAGKTTLKEALLTVFFSNPTVHHEGMQDWITWSENEKPELSIEFEDHERRTWQLRKDFEDRRIFLISREESFQTLKTIHNKVQSELGSASEALYRLVAVFEPRTLAEMGDEANRRDLAKVISGMMTGTDAAMDISQILAKVEKRLDQLLRGLKESDKQPGVIKTLKNEKVRLTAAIADHEQQLQARQDRIVAEHDARAKIEQLEQEIHQLNDHIEHATELNNAQRRWDELTQQELVLTQARDLRAGYEEALQTIQGELDALPAGVFVESEIKQLESLHAKVSRIEATDAPEPYSDRLLKSLWIGGGGAIVLGFVVLPFMLIAGLSCFALGAGVLAASFLERKRFEQKREWYENQLALRQKTIDELKVEMRGLLDKAPGTGLSDILQSWPEVQKKQQERLACQKQLGALEPIDPSQFQKIAREKEELHVVLRQADPGKDPAAKDVAALLRTWQEALARSEEKLREQRQALEQIERQLTEEQPHAEALAELAESLADKEQALKEAEREQRIWETLRQVMAQARRDTLNPARKVLEKKAGELLQVFTNGNYAQMAIDDEQLTPRLFLGASAKWLEPRQLSQGTFDQVYFALRLALAEILTGGRKPPLLLDDPLATFDRDRQASVMAHMRLYAREHQLLFFTTRSDFVKLADHLIVLNKE